MADETARISQTARDTIRQTTPEADRRHGRVTFRPLTADDVPLIIEVDHDTWYSDADEFSRQMATLEVTGLLRRVTWSCVAELDGQFVGMITAAVKGEEVIGGQLGERLAQEESAARDLLSRSAQGRHILAGYEADFDEDERFEAQARRELDAEAVLFFLRPQARGHQLGKRLFDAFIAHLEEVGKKTYWLFTDSTCSFGFYDHRGMRRTASLETAVDYMPGVTKYIYTGFVDEDVQRYANMTGEIGR